MSKLTQQRALITLLFIVIAGALIIIYLFHWHFPERELGSMRGSIDPKDFVLARNNIRTALIQALIGLVQIVGGAALLIGLYFTSRNIRIARASLKVTQRTARNNLKISQETLRNTHEAQVTERFGKAVEQLGCSEPQISLAGVYTLEQIARNSEQYHWPIMEILSAYVREKCSRQEPERGVASDDSNEPPVLDPEGEQDIYYAEQPPDQPSVVIQTILTVLGRRSRTQEAGTVHLDLHGCVLHRANFARSWWDSANFSGSKLVMIEAEHVTLKEAVLESAELRYADLAQAQLEGANLSNAILRNANLQGARLPRANLAGADLTLARLEGADLTGAEMQGTRLDSADLRRVLGLTQAQIDIAFINEHTQLPEHLHG